MYVWATTTFSNKKIMWVSDATIDQIKANIRIDDILRDFVSLQKKGGGQNLWACCPYPDHNENTPSFSIHPTRGFYKCFGCGKGGDTITFLQEVQGMSYLEAMEFLANKYNIPWEVHKGYTKNDPNTLEKESLYLLMGFAASYYQTQLTQSTFAQDYVARRGITKELITTFKLGYSTEDWRGFYHFALEKGYSKDILVTAGLVIEKGDKVYDRFRHRLMFPLYDTLGRILGFGGRQLGSEQQGAKYINSPETTIYQKSEVLYGLAQGKNAIRRAGEAYLVEGYTDLLALHDIGVPQVVASAGTSLTARQVALLKRFADRVILLFDGDEAGFKAIFRSIDILLPAGFDVQIVPLPSGEDPASYAKQLGEAAFLDYLKTHACDFIDLKVDRLLAGKTQEPHIKTAVIRNIIQRIALIPDDIKREVYLQKCSTRLDINKSLLTRTLNEIRVTKKGGETIKQNVKRGNREVHLSQKQEEETILHLLLAHAGKLIQEKTFLADYLYHELMDITFTTPLYKKLYDTFYGYWQKHNSFVLQDFIQNQSEELKKVIIDLMLKETMQDTLLRNNGSKQLTAQEQRQKLADVLHKNILRLKLKVVRRMLRDGYQALQEVTSTEAVDQQLQVLDVLQGVKVDIARQLNTVVFA
ncbi:MAG: DNA primase [Bacteroidota bacterium]